MTLSLDNNEYDFIISGMGCAGISLLLHLMQEPTISNKKILLVDADSKSSNDHTWCFWESKVGFLNNLVCNKWKKLIFHTPKASIPLDINPYNYKMIRGIDLYDYAKNITLKRTKVTWLKADVSSVGSENKLAFVMADGEKYTAKYVFNSILFDEDKKAFEKDNCYKLLQHFKGWVIETKQPVFNTDEATFMDFRVGQERGATFVYVLPTSTTKALVEYTFFNEELLDKTAYDDLLKNYLQQYWNLNDYTITETEYGVIPMTNHRFKQQDGNVINIGTAGGWTKASSGFTFQFIQKNVESIVKALVEDKFPKVKKGLLERRFDLYDSTLLNVLINGKMSGREVFYQLFSKQKIKTILRFLDNESSLGEDLKILGSVPTSIFLPAALKELFLGSRHKMTLQLVILFVLLACLFS
jgi:lycopene beta-cyclase